MAAAKTTTKKKTTKKSRAKSAETKPAAAPAPAAASGGYTVLARRYRSRDFDEIIGQEPIARTLQNAIKTGRTAHAYLFTGTRGVGKTSMARIFARALNATDELTQKEQIAEAILRGDDLDVIEIDGASNRGIADAKDLIAGAGLSPARCPYKIYIIDEVHALTKDAFNALLKTMEEPPAHVKFILCTTEAHKVPPTIQSRCQRFDFRPIATVKIAEQLRRILENEKIQADDDVIAHVAQLGNGSMRDALSIMDRLLAAGESPITLELLEQMIGLPDQALIVELVDAIISGDPAETLHKGDNLMQRGATVDQVLELLAEHFRTLLVIAACGDDSDLIDMTEESRKTAAEQAGHFDTAAIVHLIALCDSVARNARNASAARALFDALLVRMALSERFMDITAAMRDGAEALPASKPGGKKKAVTEAGADDRAEAGADDRREEAPDPRPAPKPAPARSLTETKPSAPAHVHEQQDASPTTRDGAAIWAKVQSAAEQSESIRAKVEHLRFESFDGTTMRLAPDEEGSRWLRYMRTQTEALASIIERSAGCQVQVEIAESPGAAPAPVAAPERDLESVRDLPGVRQAMDIFDAVIVDVRDAPERNPTTNPRTRQPE